MPEYGIEYPSDGVPNLWVCHYDCKVNLFVPWFSDPLCPLCEQKSYWKVTGLSYTFECGEDIEFDPNDTRFRKVK